MTTLDREIADPPLTLAALRLSAHQEAGTARLGERHTIAVVARVVCRLATAEKSMELDALADLSLPELELLAAREEGA